MPSLSKEACKWLYRADQARKVAERLTDPDAKEVMLELGQFYLHLAQADLAQARTGELSFSGNLCRML